MNKRTRYGYPVTLQELAREDEERQEEQSIKKSARKIRLQTR